MQSNPEAAAEYKQRCTMRLYTDFSNLFADEEFIKKHPNLLMLKDADIEIHNCDDDNFVARKKSQQPNKPVKPYEKYVGRPSAPSQFKQDCKDPVPVLIK
jgi:hypothetical protein